MGRNKILIPVGLTRNIKPTQNPDRNTYLLNSFLSTTILLMLKMLKNKMQLTKNLSNLFRFTINGLNMNIIVAHKPNDFDLSSFPNSKLITYKSN